MHEQDAEIPAVPKDLRSDPGRVSLTSRLDWHEYALRVVKANEKALLALAAFAQLVFLAAMAIPHASTALSGETILLRVVPVDPRDLFRGDYVILGYEISRVPTDGIDGTTPSELQDASGDWLGRTVYVGLEPEEDGRHYRGSEVHFTPPPSGRFIRGTLESRNRITFGLESFYVQEGRGREYEEAILKHRLSAAVALTPDGSSSLRDLIIEKE